MCAIVGLLCIALPIPGFIAKFQMLYEYEVRWIVFVRSWFMTVTPLTFFQSANLRGRRDMNKKLQDLQDIKNQRRSIIEAKTDDHTRFLIQEYLFNRTNMMDTWRLGYIRLKHLYIWPCEWKIHWTSFSVLPLLLALQIAIPRVRTSIKTQAGVTWSMFFLSPQPRIHMRLKLISPNLKL